MLTIEQQKRFDRNFNREAYYKAKETVQKAISNSASFEELWVALSRYERDVEYTDEGTIIFCEVELDRSHMETTGDYVGIDFAIFIDEDDKGRIEEASLFTSDTSSGDVELLCLINPNTCEVIEWYDN